MQIQQAANDLLYQEEVLDVKKTSQKNLRILYRESYKELQQQILKHIKDHKVVNISNQYGERLWNQQGSFIPLQFINCDFINTSLIIVGKNNINSYAEYAYENDMKVLVLQKPKEFIEIGKKESVCEYLSQYDVVITTTSRQKDLNILLNQSLQYTLQNSFEKQKYLEYLLLVQQNKQTPEHTKQVKYLLDQQIKGQLLKDIDFVNKTINLTGRVFERVVIDPTAYCELTSEVLGKMQWYLTTDYRFDIYQYGKKLWKDFNYTNTHDTLKRTFISYLEQDIQNIKKKNIQFVSKKYVTDMKKLPINRTTDIEIGDDEQIMSQLDLTVYSQADFPLFVKNKILQVDQQITANLNNPQLIHGLVDSWLKIKQNVLINLTNIHTKFEEKDQEPCSVCYSQVNSKVYFMCCFYSVCLQCFAGIVNSKKPLLQCILCKFTYNTTICKNLIFIKSQINCRRYVKKQDIIDDLKIAATVINMDEISDQFSIPQSIKQPISDNKPVIGYYDIDICKNSPISDELNTKLKQSYIRILRFINYYNIHEKKIQIHILGSNDHQLKEIVLQLQRDNTY